MNAPELAKPHGAWWIYFAIHVAGTMHWFLRIESPSDFLWGIFGAYGVVGLWGYLRRYAIGWHTFWRIYFVVSLAIMFIDMFSTLFEWPPIVFSLVVAYAVPYYYALWQYAFRAPQIWDGARDASA